MNFYGILIQINSTRSINEDFIENTIILKSMPATRGSGLPELADTLFYIFNYKENGFAIVSGDNRLTPILGFSEKGKFSESLDDPIVQTILLDIYGYSQNEVIRINNILPTTLRKIEKMPKTRGFLVDIPSVYTNLIFTKKWTAPKRLELNTSTTWNQGHPYNILTPVINGEHAVTGCVTTAVAQIMAYHKHPKTYKGHNYNWAEMTRNATPSSQIAKDEVARLMRDIGDIAIKEWGVSGSSSDINKGTEALHKMGYAQNFFSWRGELLINNISLPTENEIIARSILFGAPVLITAADKVSTSGWWIFNKKKYTGHAWVIDGYIYVKETIIASGLKAISTPYLYLHCNFGYSGDHDGWYIYNSFDINKGPVTTRGTKGVYNLHKEIYPFSKPK